MKNYKPLDFPEPEPQTAYDVRNPLDDRLFGGGDIGSLIQGVHVSAETAIRASAVFPCVALIAETIGSFTLEIRPRDGVEAEPHPLAEQLAYAPNPLTTGAEFWATMAYNAVLRGTAYAEPVPVADGLEIWPLVPTRLSEQHRERSFAVDYAYENGTTRRFGPASLFRFSGISMDGIRAVVPFSVAAAAIDMADTLESFGRQFFRNGARPSGVLTTDQTLGPEAAKRLRDEFNGNFAGYLNAGKVPVLEQSLKYLPITASNTDSQYIELRKNQIREIARHWRIPFHMLGEGDSSKTTEQQALDFIKYTLRPWTRRIEQAVARDFFTPEQRLIYKARFNMDGLLRGDSATQWRNAVLARTASVMSRNQIAVEWFGLPRIDEPWADDPREPLNSNRAADTQEGGMTAPQDRSDAMTDEERQLMAALADRFASAA